MQFRLNVRLTPGRERRQRAGLVSPGQLGRVRHAALIDPIHSNEHMNNLELQKGVET